MMFPPRPPMSNSMMQMQQAGNGDQREQQEMMMLRQMMQQHPDQAKSLLEWYLKKRRNQMDMDLNSALQQQAQGRARDPMRVGPPQPGYGPSAPNWERLEQFDFTGGRRM